MRPVRKVKRQWGASGSNGDKENEAASQKQPIMKTETKSADPTDWAEVWHQMQGSPKQGSMRLTIKDDDECVISINPERRERVMLETQLKPGK